MSANDILDVLNIQRDEGSQPAKKRQKLDQQPLQKGSGMARELYNLLGPNTPPVSINLGGKRDRRQKVSPWTRMPFTPNKKSGNSQIFSHWEKGSKELLESSANDQEYFFDKFLVDIDIPEMVDEATFDTIMTEIRASEREKAQEREKQRNEKAQMEDKAVADKEKKKGTSEEKKITQGEKSEKTTTENENTQKLDSTKQSDVDTDGKVNSVDDTKHTKNTAEDATIKSEDSRVENPEQGVEIKQDPSGSMNSTENQQETNISDANANDQARKSTDNIQEEGIEDPEKAEAGSSKSEDHAEPSVETSAETPAETPADIPVGAPAETPAEVPVETPAGHSKSDSSTQDTDAKSTTSETPKSENDDHLNWSFKETKFLFQFCKDFELKWHIINDRYPSHYGRTMEDLKEQFYRVSARILKKQGTGNPGLLDSLDAYSKAAEIDRKQYLESLLRRTPAEIAEEESLVIEARRFELAAKKMLIERSNLLALLDSPQSSQSVKQYSSSQGLANLYNNLMILDKHQKKKMAQKSSSTHADPVPPQIPAAASSSHKRDRVFQTHLQQYLASVLKQQGPAPKGSEPNPIQQLLAKRLTENEEEAYGLHYHANERLNPGLMLRSSQKLPGLQQRQSVFKAVNGLLQELEIPTCGGTMWKPNMPTRKTMAKYDELMRSVVALLDVKKARDKLQAEIALIRAQKSLQ